MVEYKTFMYEYKNQNDTYSQKDDNNLVIKSLKCIGVILRLEELNYFLCG